MFAPICLQVKGTLTLDAFLYYVCLAGTSSLFLGREPRASTCKYTIFNLTTEARIAAGWILQAAGFDFLKLHQGTCYCLVHVTRRYLDIRDTWNLSSV